MRSEGSPNQYCTASCPGQAHETSSLDSTPSTCGYKLPSAKRWTASLQQIFGSLKLALVMSIERSRVSHITWCTLKPLRTRKATAHTRSIRYYGSTANNVLGSYRFFQWPRI